MKDRLTVSDERRGIHRVVWFIAEADDYGATLGDGPAAEDDHGIATVAAQSTPGCEKDSTGLYWYSRAEATVALKAANAALKNKPLADWEQKALAAGWKPPKGRL